MPAETCPTDLQQVLDHTGEAVIIKDLNAVVTYWNREAASLYGFSAEEAIGKPLRSLHAADLSEADYARVLERVRAGRPSASFAGRRRRRPWCRRNAGRCGWGTPISPRARARFGAGMRTTTPQATSACPSTVKARSSACFILPST